MAFKNIGRALSAFIIICALIMGVSAYADTRNIEAKLDSIDTSGIVKITGNIGESLEGENVTLTVYIDGNYGEGLLGAVNQAGYVSAFDDTYTDIDGNFTFRFMINGEQKSGFYTAYISDTLSESPKEVTFLYSNVAERKSAIEILNTKTTAQEVYDYVFGQNGKWMDLGFYSKLQSSLDKMKISELIAERVNETGAFDKEKGDEVSKEYLYLEAIDGFNEGKIGSISEYADRFIFKNGEISLWLGKEYVTSQIDKNIADRVSGRNFKNANEFENALIEAVILETVKNNDGPGTVRDILTDYKSKLTANVQMATISNFRQLMGEYASITELDEKLKELINGNGSNSSGGGGGGGGGSSSGKDKNDNGMNGVSGSVIEITGDDKKPVATIVEKERFSDLGNVLWAKDAINALYDKGIINGRAENIFAPEDNITREEFVKIIAMAFGIPTTDESCGFADVNDSEWYGQYVNSAYKAGVVSGIGENMFGTGMKISRQDMAVMVYNGAKISGKTINAIREKIEFNDEAMIAPYAKEAVLAMQRAGVISGTGDNMFSPLGNATRAEAAKMVYGLISLQ